MTGRRWLEWNGVAPSGYSPAPQTGTRRTDKKEFCQSSGRQTEGSANTQGGVERTERAPNLDQATAVLNASGTRIVLLSSVATIGVWNDLDGPEVRAARSAAGIGEDLRRLGERIRAIYRAAAGIMAKDQNEERG
jgi:hypothetical protein